MQGTLMDLPLLATRSLNPDYGRALGAWQPMALKLSLKSGCGESSEFPKLGGSKIQCPLHVVEPEHRSDLGWGQDWCPGPKEGFAGVASLQLEKTWVQNLWLKAQASLLQG